MRKILLFVFLLWTEFIYAQIGYQVSLLNSATGQPRAGETVTVDIKLTNCENATVYTTQQKATSNDFGVLSLSVGDTKTFDELDWNKLPLYIEVSIDDVLIAKSQVLSVPVAEYAKKSGFVLTKEFLASKTWKVDFPLVTYSFDFNEDGGCIYKKECKMDSECNSITASGDYNISDNLIYCSIYNEDKKTVLTVFSYNHIWGALVPIAEVGLPSRFN